MCTLIGYARNLLANVSVFCGYDASDSASGILVKSIVLNFLILTNFNKIKHYGISKCCSFKPLELNYKDSSNKSSVSKKIADVVLSGNIL